MGSIYGDSTVTVKVWDGYFAITGGLFSLYRTLTSHLFS